MTQGPRIGTVFEEDHRRIDAALSSFHEGLARGDRRHEALAVAAAALRRHIYVEEAVLFPPLRRAGMAAPVGVMVREHGEIWEALTALEAALDAGEAPASLIGPSTRLRTLLAAHNFKEEQALYPTADHALGRDLAAEAVRGLAEAVTPPGWRPGGLTS